MRFFRHNPRRFIRRPAFALAILSLMVTALATFGSGVASAQPARPASPQVAAQKVAPAAKAAPESSKTITFRVVNVTGQQMSVVKSAQYNGHWRAGNAPRDGDPIYDTDTYSYLMESVGGQTDGGVQYSIGTTGYSVTFEGWNGDFRPNGARCDISPQGSPYRCLYSATSGNDNYADAVVEPITPATHTLTDSTSPTRRDAVDGLCSPFDSNAGLPYTVACTAGTLDDITPVYGGAQPASSTLVNCGSVTNSINYLASYTTGETNTVGVTTEAQIKISDAWTQKVAVSYQHSWTTSRTSSQTVTLNVPAGRYGYISATPVLISITGNYTLTAGNQTYQIGAFTVNQPATDAWLAKNPAWKDTLRTQDFAMDRDAVCEGATNPISRPQLSDIKAGGTYTITLAGYNQWAVTVPDRSHDPGKVIEMSNLTASGLGRSAQWTLVPIPGQPAGNWQLSSANTPQFCLTADTATVVYQTTCATPGNPGLLSAQTWNLSYDPAAGGYQVIQPAGAFPIRLRIDQLPPSTGLPVRAGTGDAGPNRGRWVLNSVTG